MTDEELAELVTGYANGFDRALQETGMDEEDLRNRLLDLNIEECRECHWFTDSHFLINDDNEIDGHCDNCREDD